jgi:hypothetical protein
MVCPTQEYKDLEFIYRYLDDAHLDYSPAVIFAYHYSNILVKRPMHFAVFIDKGILRGNIEGVLKSWWNLHK